MKKEGCGQEKKHPIYFRGQRVMAYWTCGRDGLLCSACLEAQKGRKG